MTIMFFLSRTTHQILLSFPTRRSSDLGVADLASDNAKQLTYSVSSFEIPKQSLSSPIITLKLEELKHLLTQLGHVRPKIAVFEKFEDTDGSFAALIKRFQGTGSPLYASSYHKWRQLYHTTTLVEEMTEIPHSNQFAMKGKYNGPCMSKMGAPLVEVMYGT